MNVERIDIDQARHASGLRIVTLARIPSPWGEALKGILHIKLPSICLSARGV
jgi:hypothetical protein